ncbi:MAG: heavy metal translocating P-type ATPase [Thermoleophilia bacterium]
MEELAIGGMSCAACAARIEKRLNRMDGVTATVNYATGRASVSAPAEVTLADITETVEKLGYTATTAAGIDDGHARDGLRPRLIAALVLGLPVLVMSMVPGAQFRGWQWLSLVLVTPVVTWSAWPIHAAALKHLRQRTTTMDTLVSLGVVAAYGWSLWALFATDAGHLGMTMEFTLVPRDAHGGGAHIYLEVAAVVVALILLGRVLEARATQRAGDAVRALLDRRPQDATVVRPDGSVEVVAADRLTVGDRVLVRPGERIPADGVVEDGSSAVDMSLVTGESLPVDVSRGDEVVGSGVNTSGSLIVRATAVGSETRLAQMARLVAEAQQGKAQIARLADRVAAVFVPIVLAIAALTLVGQLLTGAAPDAAVTAAVAVLVIACPCALGLATPTALLAGTGRGAQLGIFIRGPQVLETSRNVDTVLLDKTGTLTTGTMRVTAVHVADGVDRDRFLRLVGAAEAASEHPIGRAIAAHAGADPGLVADVTAEAGAGISATVDGVEVRVGRDAWLGGPDSADGLLSVAAESADAGETVVWASLDGRRSGIIALSDTIRPDAREAVAGLRALDIRPRLVTGDAVRPATAIGQALGFSPDEIHAEVRPEGKLELVSRFQDDGHRVAMVGDGLNDGAALARADLGIAMSTGTDVAMEASDMTLVDGRIGSVVDAIRLARRTLGTIRGNLFWAFAYNVAAIPLAALGLLNPMIAAAAMACSSLFVVGNSLRLRRFTPSAG